MRNCCKLQQIPTLLDLIHLDLQDAPLFSHSLFSVLAGVRFFDSSEKTTLELLEVDHRGVVAAALKHPPQLAH